MEKRTFTENKIGKGSVVRNADMESLIQLYRSKGFQVMQQTSHSTTLFRKANKISVGGAVLLIFLLQIIGAIIVAISYSKKDYFVCIRQLPDGQLEASGDVIYEKTKTVTYFSVKEKLLLGSGIAVLLGVFVGVSVWRAKPTQSLKSTENQKTLSSLNSSTNSLSDSSTLVNSSTNQNVDKKFQILVDESFSIEAENYQSIPLEISKTSKITGTFSVKNGQKIEVVVFDEQGYFNFTNGMKASKVYFNSRGYVSNGKIENTFNTGNYYLILNNVDDFVNMKEVTAKIYIEN